ncbi:hypothetical protein N1851_034888 [Merluccius polli]|uniref:Uncharacterized protein n=1 Tax=Merluccius polli TaxID=89951 RepID=A0AA47LZ39_MERPO|nr:hypothetical protein N1851_034888 [Merluccius polli]
MRSRCASLRCPAQLATPRTCLNPRACGANTGTNPMPTETRGRKNTTPTTEPTAIQTKVLRGLPIILGDDPTNFFKAGFDSDDDDSLHDLDIGILLIERDGTVLTSSQHLSPTSLKIIIEGQVVMDNIQDLPKAMCILFGLTYALHLNYPKTMKLTFQFIQQVLLSLGHTDLKPKLLTLKNQLAI